MVAAQGQTLTTNCRKRPRLRCRRWRAARAAGKDSVEVEAASRLGNPYRVYEQTNMFHLRSAGAFREYNTEHGLPAGTPVPAEVRARIRSDVATTMFTETYGRDAANARELSGHLAWISRRLGLVHPGVRMLLLGVSLSAGVWRTPITGSADVWAQRSARLYSVAMHLRFLQAN
jgi:hypothetical protein